MANHVELKYSNINDYISILKQIDDKLEYAYKQLAESTDFGSTAMQATWSFGSKKAIFNTLSQNKKDIKRMRNVNEDLMIIINSLDDNYEKVAKKSKKDIATERRIAQMPDWIKAARLIITPVILPFMGLWAGPAVISVWNDIIGPWLEPDFILDDNITMPDTSDTDNTSSSGVAGWVSDVTTEATDTINDIMQNHVPLVEVNENYNIPDAQGVEITPHKTNAEGHRSADSYREVLADLNVEGRKRYARTPSDTWCNIYVWDATKAMGCEIPHYYDPKTGKELTRAQVYGSPGGLEMSANRMTQWLIDHGSENGWIPCDAETAQKMANQGMPTVVAATTTGHVAMVSPHNEGDSGVMISQAGARNFQHGSLNNGFGRYSNDVVYYYHP